MTIKEKPFFTEPSTRTSDRQTHPELHSVDEASTLVTLITASLWIAAVRTGAFYKAISQKALTVFTAKLLHCVFYKESILVESPEYILSDPETKENVQLVNLLNNTGNVVSISEYYICFVTSYYKICKFIGFIKTKKQKNSCLCSRRSRKKSASY